MNKMICLNHSFRRIKYALAGMIFFLLTTQVYADRFEVYNHLPVIEITAHHHQAERRMFIIAVIDSDDKTIGERCTTDYDALTEAFRDYAKDIKATFVEPKEISGDSFSKEAVNDALNNWLGGQQLSANDIVIFYYSGHGFRFLSDAGNYPRMWLKNSRDNNVETASLSLEEDIYNHLIKEGAGVNIVIADCCNSTVAGENASFDNITVPTRKRPAAAEKNEDDNDNTDDDGLDNAEKLFVPGHHLSMLVAAAGKGELAGGKAENGGFFTNYLIEALDNCIYDNSILPEWQNIFKYADDKASYWARSAACPEAKHNEQGRCVQTAEIKIDDAN